MLNYIRLYNDGNGHFIWPKGKTEIDLHADRPLKFVPAEPPQFQMVVYTEGQNGGMRGCLIEGSSAFPSPDAKTIGLAILMAAKRLEDGGGAELAEGQSIDGLEKIVC